MLRFERNALPPPPAAGRPVPAPAGADPVLRGARTRRFPSPAEGYLQRPIDLNELLVSNPPSTFMFRVEGQSMIGAHIHDGDLVIVDRAREAFDKDIVLAVIDGEFTVKRFRRTHNRSWLQPENAEFPCIELGEEREGRVADQ